MTEASWIAIAAAGLLAAVGLYVRGRRLGRALAEARDRLRDLEAETVDLRADAARRRRESELLARFLREYPQVAGGLHGEVEARRLPRLHNHVVTPCLTPWQALVLLRRRGSMTEPKRARRFVVAAVARPDEGIDPGMELEAGAGPLGLAAELQQAMTRRELEREPSLARRRRASEGPLARFEPDLVAPMVFEDETVGLIALRLLDDHPATETEKGLLRIVCQAGALAVHNAMAYSEMKMTAQMDGLTRLYNKTYTSFTLAERICEAQERHRPLSVFLFDVDHFKHYNDTNGHDAGDHLLRELALLVQENVRATDVLGRFGGEEFLLILPDTSRRQALVVAEKVRRLVAAHPFPHADRQPLGRVSISGGVAAYPDDGLDSASLLRAADEALYASKRAGRNRVGEPPAREIGAADETLFDRSVLERALEQATGGAPPTGTEGDVA